MYVRIRGKVIGPLDETRMLDLVRQGKISRASEVSNDGQTWMRAGEHQTLFTAAAASGAEKSFESMLAREKPELRNSHDTEEPKSWFYSIDGRSGFGPLSRLEIGALIRQGTLKADSLVWKQGEMADTVRYTADFAEFLIPVRSKPSGVTGPPVSSAPTDVSQPKDSMQAQPVVYPEPAQRTNTPPAASPGDVSGNDITDFKSGLSRDLVRETLRSGPWIMFLTIVASAVVALISLGTIGGVILMASKSPKSYTIASSIISFFLILFMLMPLISLWKLQFSITGFAVHQNEEKLTVVIRQMVRLFRGAVLYLLSLAVLAGISFLVATFMLGMLNKGV